jgi:hypothetical protein
MKHRNLHRAIGNESPDERLRLAKVAQNICTQLQIKAEPQGTTDAAPVIVNLSEASEDYTAYLQTFDVRN